MDKKKLHQCFPPSLFWNVDPNPVDIDMHAGFIIERVITHGNFEDWTTLLKLYGKKRVRDEVVTIRSLDPKSLNPHISQVEAAADALSAGVGR